MFINEKQLKQPIDFENKIKLLRFLPTKRISDIVTCLIIKHEEDFYLVKIRPSHEYKIETEDFIVVKKGDILGCDNNLDNLVGKFIVFDITGFYLENIQCK